MKKNFKFEISIILPCYNEQEGITKFIDKLVERLEKKITKNFEIIIVDDGSQDRTKEVLIKLCKKNKKVKLISFTKNFGHQSAILAGLERSSGKAIVIMDSDFQHPIEILDKFYYYWKSKKTKIVHGIKKKQQTTIIKNILSIIGYFLLNLLSNHHVEPGGSDFYLIDREVKEKILEINEPNIIFRMYFSLLGYKKKNVFFNSNKRKYGDSKYDLSKSFYLFRNGMLTSSIRPIRAILSLGIIAFLISIFFIIFQLYEYFYTDNLLPPGFATLAILILIFGGINILAIGLIGEYLSYLIYFKLSKFKYVVDETKNFRK